MIEDQQAEGFGNMNIGPAQLQGHDDHMIKDQQSEGSINMNIGPV